MGRNEQSVLKTLIYSDIFHYPLREDEVFWYLIADTPLLQKTVRQSLKQLFPLIVQKRGYYVLERSKIFVKTRENRLRPSREKLHLAKRVAQVLSLIPTVVLIGVSGGVSMENASTEDDIDFFLITKRKTLFITRMLCLLLLSFLGRRRKRFMQHPRDMICLNMVLDESDLSLPKKRQNLYSAHEVVQLVPLVEREKAYERFVGANAWVFQFLPNSKTLIQQNKAHIVKRQTNYFSNAAYAVLVVVEPFAKLLQMILIRRHKTTETIDQFLLAFHPVDYQKKVEKAFQKRLQAYKLYNKYYV
ncbi:MAG: hypothetical protein HY430_03900 [Candidatus Levybacteria bacterium]|nr:hypothetical protein [Candidatus Levybacteria bacterium]